jgi:uridine kinase
MERIAPLLVALTGGTCSGKTTLAERLRARLSDLSPLVVHQDEYFRDWGPADAESRTRNAPDAVRWDLLRSDLQRLAAGQTVGPPPARAGRPQPPDLPRSPGRLVLAEGHLLLVDEALRGLFDLKVYLDAPDEERVLRRMLRSAAPGGLEGAAAWYRRDVLPNHARHTAPTRWLADLVLPTAPLTDAGFEALVAAIRAAALPPPGSPPLG